MKIYLIQFFILFMPIVLLAEEYDHDEWKKYSIEFAVEEAKLDIKNKDIHIYWSGTDGYDIIGIPYKYHKLLKRYPEKAGWDQGCVIFDRKLYESKTAHAKAYNEYVFKYLLESNQIKEIDS